MLPRNPGISYMRTRALFNMMLSLILLAVLLAVDLVAHTYRPIQGIPFEFLRALIQGIAIAYFGRGVFTLFFRGVTVSRAGDKTETVNWPLRLVRRFSVILVGLVAISFLPELFRISVTKEFEPSTFGSLISVDVVGTLWLYAAVAAALSFWQIVFVRQNTRSTRRRFEGWAIAIAAYSLFSFLGNSLSFSTPFLNVVLAILGVLVIIAALLLGYRLPWIPYVPREAKRRLLLFSVLNLALGIIVVAIYYNSFAGSIFRYYAQYWQICSALVYGTISIYFALIFFSTLFSLSSTELVERKSAEVKSLVRLTRFSSDVLSSELLLDLPKLAEQITSLACEATEADCAWLELRANTFNPEVTDTRDQTIRSMVNIDEAEAERIMSSNEGFPEAGRTIASPRAELQASRRAFVLKKHRQLRQTLKRDTRVTRETNDLHSLVAVPLLRKGEVRGGLYVAKRREDGFDDDDLTVLTAFSDVASLALETARLLADSIEKQKFDGELRAARAMQKSLLPERFQEIPGFEIDAVSIPAYDVGGDYYDSSVLWDGSTVVGIGDVSGKGISASLYMAETKGVVQATAPLMSTLQELLEGTNNALLRNSPTHSGLKRSFVTLGMLAFKPDGIHYCRAGHTPLLIVRANGEYEYVQPKGMAVGLMKQTLFNHTLEERVLQASAGDVFVLYSDGITDVRNEAGEDLGYENLARAVVESRNATTARAITAKVLEAVAAYSGSHIFGDDATIVVLRCTSTPAIS